MDTDLLQDALLGGLAWLLIAIPVGGLCLVGWLRLGRRGVLPRQRERAVPWTAGEVLIAFLGLQIWPMLAMAGMEAIFGPADKWEQLYRLSLAMELAWPVHVAVLLAAMQSISGTRPYQVGLTGAHWRRGLLLGALAWLVVCLPVYLVELAVASMQRIWFKEPTTPHDMARLMGDRFPALEWQLLLWVTLIVVPWAEEIIFRGVMQRWAGRFAWRSHLLLFVALLLALGTRMEAALPSALFVLVLVPAYHFSPLWFERLFPIALPPAVPDDIRPEVSDLDRRRTLLEQLPARWAALFDPARQDLRVNQPRAVFATAIVFGVVHTWPTTIPIFCLGLALGWLAYRTQSLIASVTLHALFNAVACATILLERFYR